MKTAHQRKTLTSKITANKSAATYLQLVMGRLVIILAFSLGALLMLESAQAGKDCNIYVIRVRKPNNIHEQGYIVTTSVKELISKYKSMKKNNPKIKLLFEKDKTYHVSNCKAALEAVKDKIKDISGGREWFHVTTHEDRKYFYSVVDPLMKKYLKPNKKLPIAMAEDDDDYDDDNMIDSGNARLRLQELLLRLLD